MRVAAIRFAAVLGCLLWLGLFCAVGWGDVPATQDAPPQQGGFSVRKADRSLADALEEFESYRDKKQWEKAFGALAKTADAKLDGLVPGKDGLYVSASSKIRQELLTLSPEGRQAYRLFNDAKAEQLLNDAVRDADDASGAKVAGNSPRADSTEKLREIVDRYFITSTGDRAADRLGDALFEAGDFAGAQASWQLILDDYPDSSLSAALLQTKCAIALARAGQWEKFAAAKAMIRDRYAGQTVRLGGRDVVATEYLDGLSPDASIAAGPATQPTGVSVSTLAGAIIGDTGNLLPDSAMPIWQVPLLDGQMQRQMGQLFQQYNFSASVGPVVAADDRRLYLNWFGIYFAVDLHTGKLLWRSEPFNDLWQKNMVLMSMNSPGSLTVTPMGKNVLFTGGSPNGGGPQGAGSSQLFCLTADEGKPVWQSDRGSLSGWSFAGSPILGDEGIYTCAYPAQTRELHLLCISPATGELQWETTLGSPDNGPSNDGEVQQGGSSPLLLEHHGTVYVLTNNGALLAVDPSLRRVGWAFKYAASESFVQGRGGFMPFGGSGESPPGQGAMLVVGSTLYIKEYAADRLYALDLTGPKLKWARPVDGTVALAGAVGNRLYLVGDEVDCIDADSRDLLWVDKLSPATDSQRPILSADHIYVLDQRGLRSIRTDTGDTDPIFRGYDHDGLGGILWQTPGRLVTVSGVAVTAYPLNRRGDEPP